MGRKRKTRKDLPERVYFNHNAYFFVTLQGKWIRLGSNFVRAMAKWAEIVGTPQRLTTMGKVMDRYMFEIAPQKAPRTYTNNLKEIKLLKEVFGHMMPDDIKSKDIYNYLDIRGKKAPVAANREKSLLSSIFNYAIRWGVTENNPCRGVIKLKENKRDRYITDEEFKLIRMKASPLIKCVMNLAYITSQRRGDILNIRLSDIKDDGLYFQQGKTGKKLVFKMTAALADVIREAKSLRRPISSLHLFCNRKGQKYTDDGFSTLWQRIIKKTGIEDVHFHDIRAKAITDAKRQGRDAQMLAGHETSAMTDRYVKNREVEVVEPLEKIGN